VLTRTAASEDDIHRRVLRLVQQLLTPNSCDLTARSMKEIIELSAGKVISGSLGLFRAHGL
jgi:hypothetical protein